MNTDSRQAWLDLLQRTGALLEVLHGGGLTFADGRFNLAPADPIARARPEARPVALEAAAAPAVLTPEMREALKSSLIDPYAHLTAQPTQPTRPLDTPAPSRPPAAAHSTQEPSMQGKSAGVSTREAQMRRLAEADKLELVHELVRQCCACGLGETRTHGVPGEGNPQADLMFIGEGPGYNEDIQGRPFVGKAGQLLDKMIEAMGMRREDVYITNIVKCRPPNNREPTPEEMKLCEPFLLKQLALIRPKVICTLGRIAIQGLLKDCTPITRLRGQWREYNGVPVMPTFHPAYLLRNPTQKRPCWEDLQAVMARLKDLGASCRK